MYRELSTKRTAIQKPNLTHDLILYFSNFCLFIDKIYTKFYRSQVFISGEDDFNDFKGFHKIFVLFKGGLNFIQLLFDFILRNIFLPAKTAVGSGEGADHRFILSSVFQVGLNIGWELYSVQMTANESVRVEFFIARKNLSVLSEPFIIGFHGSIMFYEFN